MEPLELPTQPFPLRWAPAHSALVVIDMQRDFLEPGGFGHQLGNDVGLLASCLGPVVTALDLWRRWGLPVIHTQESHDPDLLDCPPSKLHRSPVGLRIGDRGPMGRILVRGEPGCDFIESCRPLPGEKVYHKPGKGAFWQTSLHTDLQKQGIRQLFFCGVTTEVCVQTSLREANDRGYECVLLEDATASYFPHFKQAVLEMVRAQGAIIGWTLTTAQLKSAGEGRR